MEKKDKEELKAKVLTGCLKGTGIPVKNMANYVLDGVITLEELKIAGLSAEKIGQIEQLLAEFEETMWDEVKTQNTVSGYQKYLSCYPCGKYSEDANSILIGMEETFWQTINQDLTEDKLKEYEKAFPNGKHIEECKVLLDDLPYLGVKREDTIKAYNDYMARFPGKHTEEILTRIEEIEDENDWKTACANNTKEGYKIYIENHKKRERLENHSHAEEASDKINHRSGKEIFIEKLKADPNSLSAGEIRKEIDNGTAKWDDLLAVFGSIEKIKAIKDWSEAAELPVVPDLEKLPDGYTEVYFWGTKGTGKTCVIGSLLGSLKHIKQNFIPLSESNKAGLYMTNLCNLFKNKNNICTLPDSTKTTNLPAMTFRIKDEKKRQHQLMLIDMAGEAFTGIYKKRQGKVLLKEEEQAVSNIEKYLLGKQKNKKIHFFVIEYGGEDKDVDPTNRYGIKGVKQEDVLQDVAQYFQEKGVFQKTSVGAFVIVTKCDKIPCPREQRAQWANEYVSKGSMGTFVKNLRDEYAKSARINSVFKKYAFSIGDVFAQNLCVFDDADTDKIINQLLNLSPWQTGDKWWEKLLGWLRYH